jgi:hypothetical protein
VARSMSSRPCVLAVAWVLQDCLKFFNELR